MASVSENYLFKLNYTSMRNKFFFNVMEFMVLIDTLSYQYIRKVKPDLPPVSELVMNLSLMWDTLESK